ncbi:hypothetical protein A7U43_27290 [Mycobacterium adipatum]|uniref:Uncharacterized protein n=1 Tax=Mycobacterium adipatum TaxID=1682113 RepID=A0A172UU07_9MYCO|nr:hypothetical protein A7U43_27290 [Mycobacterium adipatum]
MARDTIAESVIGHTLTAPDAREIGCFPITARCPGAKGLTTVHTDRFGAAAVSPLLPGGWRPAEQN